MARRKGAADEEEAQLGESGLKMTSIAISLKLLVFFIYLSTTTPPHAYKSHQAVQSLRSAFGIEKLSPEATSPVRRIRKLVAIDKDLSRLVRDFRKVIKDENLDDFIEVFVDQDDLVINFSDKVLFPSGSAEMHQKATEILGKIGKGIVEAGRPIRVEGHTDNVPIATERYPSNWDLSSARASTILRYLAERWKVSGERLIAIGLGEHQPIAPNLTAENRAKNRRVTIILPGAPKPDAKKEG